MFSSDSFKSRSVFSIQGIYSIQRRAISPASRVFFIYNEQYKRHLCIKMWKAYDNGLYQTTELKTRIKYLLEGFNFNRVWGQGVYLGLASIELVLDNNIDGDNATDIVLGSLLTPSRSEDLEEGKEYAQVMECLDEAWQLSKLLPSKLRNKDGMEFLARELCNMHNRLSSDPKELQLSREIGSVDTIAWKLALNKQYFQNALARFDFLAQERERYESITWLMDRSYKKYLNLFAQRCDSMRIKRCHGDLKLTNLWMRPAMDKILGFPLPKPQLIALDCIDFKPQFCHIDTLSDVAMLTVDIELHLGLFFDSDSDTWVQSAKELAHYFLEMYIYYAQEDRCSSWSLLEYYMIEKAMIGAYNNILHDSEPDVGMKYLSTAYTHAENLRSLLPE